MNKQDFITHISSNHDMTKTEAEKIIDVFTKSVMEVLGKKESISLIGFGNFQVKHFAAREGKNPKTGDKMMIAAHHRPSFKAGKKLKDAVN